MSRSIAMLVAAVAVMAVMVVLSCAGAGADEDGRGAEWYFEEGFGSVVEDSSEDEDCGLTHGASWVDGNCGKALRFDEMDTTIYTPTVTVTGTAFEPFTFVHITDVHIGYTLLDSSKTEAFVRSSERFADTLQAIKTHNPEFILSPGDLVEYSEEDFFNAYMGVSKSLDIPLYNTPGNHDRHGWDPRDDVGLTTYDEIIKNPGDIKPIDDGYRDYYFNKYGYRFIGMDSGADYNVSLPPFLESSNMSTLVSYDSW